jgi:hypothetical protein
MYQDLHRFFPELFDANLDLQALFSTEMNDSPSWSSFCNVFLPQYTLAKLDLHIRDLLEYIL